MSELDAPTILAIETSCDDTAVAVVRGTVVLSNVISSQSVHNTWGGIVPELASREHVRAIGTMVQLAMMQADVEYTHINAIAVTQGPGLPGSLLVGTQFAKGLALRLGSPLLPVHHIQAHVYSGYLEDPTLPMPSICLVVSGGHTALFYVEDWTTHRMIGSTRDDAAGEAFDKVAKLVGLGYPGGPHIDRLSQQGDPEAFSFPRGLAGESGFDFSFSGLKTAVRRALQPHAELDSHLVCNIAASAQRAIVDVLVAKTIAAAEQYGVSTICIAGGVSANSELRTAMHAQCANRGWRFIAPRNEYCIDNAAMIGFVAARQLSLISRGTMNFGIQPQALRAR